MYSLWARFVIGQRIGHETLSGGERNNMQFNNFVSSGPLTGFYKAPDTVWTPHVLKDGADSVGALGALNRVYINIGLFSEEWLTHFNPVAGGKRISPIEIAVARKNSAYWRATEKGTVNTALFFLKAAQPDRLADAPGGKAFLTATPEQWSRGRDVFADTCARCHSSKQPKPPAGIGIRDGIGKQYLNRFLGWWRWTQTPGYKQQMRAIAARPDFAKDNYFSSDARIPVTLLRTNLCSPLASNAIAGNIWDNFSSSSYKQLPSVGKATVQDPFTGQFMVYTMPAGGRGYTRVPSLISLWSTAPYLLNNSVGPFNGDPSVAGRMKAFDASIQQMLWPERRERDRTTPNALGIIDRTSARSYLFIPSSFVPRIKGLADRQTQQALDKLTDKDGNIVIGPIPAGTPVGLIASLRPLAESSDANVIAAHYARLVQLLVRLKASLLTVPKTADDAALRAHFVSLRLPLMKLSKCPDYVVNKGHYFGTAMFNNQSYLTDDERSFGTEPVLSDADKMALIAYLKSL